MPRKVMAIVVTGNGTNCEMEMAHACRLAGADQVDIVHISQLLYNEKKLDDYHFLNLPGGFLDGDDLGSAKAGANRILHATLRPDPSTMQETLLDGFRRFIRAGKLILGVCNGFQLLVKLGTLPGFDGNYFRQTSTLTFNDSGRFEDRWVYLKTNTDSPCVFTRGIKSLYLPVRHGEGKFIAMNTATLKAGRGNPTPAHVTRRGGVPPSDNVYRRLHRNGHVVLQYSTEDCRAATMEYPCNPNGAVDAIAGICDETGRIFGLMPHPEAYLHYTNHPRWTREKLPEEGMGLALFKNAVKFIRSREF